MRVLHVIDHLGIGGAQVLMSNLCLGRARRGLEVMDEVLVLRGQGEFLERLRNAGISTTPLEPLANTLAARVFQLRRRLQERHYDVLDLHLPASSLLGVFLSPVRSRPPIIVNVHALKAQLPRPLFYQFRVMAPRVDKFIVFLPNSQSDLRSIGIRDAQISFIPMGLDFDAAAPQRHLELKSVLAAQYHFDATRPLLLSVARLAADRHMHVIVEAMQHLVKRRPDVLLLMVGEGEARARLEAMVVANALHKNVIFAGARTDGWNLFPACDVYLSMCGGCRIGVAAFEAMACERAVVAHNLDPMILPTAVCDEQGIFVAARDANWMAQAVLGLLMEPARAQAMGQRARENVLERLSLSAMVRRYNQLYRELTKARVTC